MSRHLATAVAALGAANTVNALRPLGRGHVARAMPSFAYGLPTSEFALPLAAVQAGAALAFRRSLSPAARALTGASIAGLVGAEVQARRAPKVLDAALTEALGAGYRDRARHPRPAPERMPGIIETARAHAHYTESTANVSYGPAGHRNMLDIWRRADLPRDGKAPVLVQIHGGGWMTGDRTVQAYPLMSLMAELGWICASISYRLAPRAAWPAQIDDVKDAIRWITANIADHGGDPDFVCVTGGSAGGHLTMLAALDPELGLQAAAPFYGPPDWTNAAGYKDDLLGPALATRIVKQPLNDDTRDLYEQASPMHHIHAEAPPFFVLAAELDNLVSPADVRDFAERLKETSRQPVAFAELPGAFHAWDIFAATRGRASARAVADFLGAVYAGTGASA